MIPPKAKKITHTLKKHNHERIDNYYWLRDKENKEVIDYLNKENDYTEFILSEQKDLKESIFNEIVGRIKKDDSTVPFRRRGYYYYTRYEGKGEYPMYCRMKDDKANNEEIILDVNTIAEGKPYCHVAGVSISPDNKMLAYGVDFVSRRQYTIFFKNIETGQVFDIQIPDTTGSLTWANDNKTVFYTIKDEETLRSAIIKRHELGKDLKEDVQIFYESDESFSCGIYKCKSDKYLMIHSSSSTSTEYRFLDADKPEGEFKIFQTREKDHEYAVVHFADVFYVVTNDMAKNFRLMKTAESITTKENWQEVIPHRIDTLLEDIELFDEYMVLSERKDGLSQIHIIESKTGLDYYLDFGEEVYVAGLSMNPEHDTSILRYSYSSLTTPPSVIDFNMRDKSKVIKKQQEVIGTFSPSDYEAKRLWINARDGVKVPVSMVYKKNIDKTIPNPLLLYGYGSYGISIDPAFSSVRLSLLDRGFIFAIAHIRGGQELGREWYDTGKMLQKKNTFYDFIDCAEFLIKEKYTSQNLLFAKGGSAGGLLMGAVINMRSTIFKGIIASVPFVDVITTMLDDTIPLTTGEYEEWGNPNEKEYYDYMLSYSPYDNVEKKDYPAMLVTTGLHDSQVQYWEPAKWVAKLRDYKTDANLLLMHTNMDAGHGGASGRFEGYRETALEYAFMLKILASDKKR